jgi:hypothetical protein
MGVNILLLDSSASVILKTGISDENGLFEIVISEPGIYRLKINKINFEAFDSSRIIYTEDMVLSDVIFQSNCRK